MQTIVLVSLVLLVALIVIYAYHENKANFTSSAQICNPPCKLTPTLYGPICNCDN